MSDGQVSAAALGVLGGDGTVADVVEAAGATPRLGSAADLVAADTDAVLAVGEAALVDLVRAGATGPVLPIDAGRGVRSVPGSGVAAAVDRLLGGEWTTVEHPVVTVDASVGSIPVVFDVMLVTDEPARISEYTVRSGDRRVDTFRADGVVVATPAGSTDYTRAAGGPVVAPGTDAAAVVPVAPFATDADHWVLALDAVELRVERDEAPIELLADGRASGTVDPAEPVALSITDRLGIAVVPGSRRFWSE